MMPKVGMAVIVIGPIANGTNEHPALVTRIWEDKNTREGPVKINAVMFPDGGGEPQFQNQIFVCENRKEALAAMGPIRTAYVA